MSADEVGTARQVTGLVVGVLGVAALERGLLWGVLFTVAMLPLSEAAKNIGFGVSLALYLALLLLHDRQRPAVPLVGLGLLGLLGAAILSALASNYPYHSARGVWEVFRHVSFFFIALRAFQFDADIRRFVAAIAAGTGAAALIFFYQYFLVGMPGFSFLSLGERHSSARFLVMVLLLLFSVLAVVRVDMLDRCVLAATALVLLLVLGLTDARASWLAFIFLGLGLAVWLRRWLMTAAVAGLVVIVTLMAIQDEAMRQRLGYISTVHGFLQLSGRIPLWEKSLRIWRDHPWFGVGPRALKIDEDVTKDPVRRRYGIEKGIGHAHNLWVHTAAEMGTVGLLGLLGWVATVAVFLWRLRGVRGDPWVRALWAATVGAFAVMMIVGVTEPSIGYEYSLLLNAELALLVGAEAVEGDDDGPRRQKQGVEEIRR